MSGKDQKGLHEFKKFTEEKRASPYSDRRVHTDEDRDILDRVAIVAFAVFLQEQIKEAEGTGGKPDLNAAAHQAYCAGKVMLRNRRHFIDGLDQSE